MNCNDCFKNANEKAWKEHPITTKCPYWACIDNLTREKIRCNYVSKNCPECKESLPFAGESGFMFGCDLNIKCDDLPR